MPEASEAAFDSSQKPDKFSSGASHRQTSISLRELGQVLARRRGLVFGLLGGLLLLCLVYCLVAPNQYEASARIALRTAPASALSMDAAGPLAAASILSAPLLFAQAQFVQNNSFLRHFTEALRPGEPWYELLYMLAIIFFAYFYISIVFRPDDIADNMRKYGGFIPGIRPGRSTSDYMNTILTRITLVGAVYLAILCMIPDIMLYGIHLQHLPLVGNFIDQYFPRWMLEGLNVQFYFGGTSLLIVVGVAMDTVNQVEAQLIMRHYDGFTPRAGRIRGRRG